MAVSTVGRVTAVAGVAGFPAALLGLFVAAVVPNGWAFAVLAAADYLAGAKWAAVGAGIAVLAALAAAGWLARHAWRSRHLAAKGKVLAAVNEQVVADRPEVVVYFSGALESAYQLNGWLPVLDRLQRRV